MAELPADPRGLELEDFVAAHLSVRGVFVASGVTHRDPEDILELDIVWTDYSAERITQSPMEIKSGHKWGIGEVFKFYGWMNYLGFDHGSFLCRRLPSDRSRDTMERLCKKLGIQLIHIENLEATRDLLSCLGVQRVPDESMTGVWQYSYWAQRRLLDALAVAKGKEKGCPVTALAAWNYAKLIRDAVFFETDPRARVERLFENHQDHPRLAATAAKEIDSGEVDFGSPPTDSATFRAALYNGEHVPIQSCFYLSHRARLAILKCAVDLEIAESNGPLPRQVFRFGDIEIDLADSQLYPGFRSAMDQLKELSSFRLLPAFWQTFLWCWGGFILTNLQKEEYAALSAETGVPIEEINPALSAFDVLFKNAAPWFRRPSGDSRAMLKMMPAPLRGIGAFARQVRYGVNSYDDLRFTDQTAHRMAVDHNAGVRLLDCARVDLA